MEHKKFSDTKVGDNIFTTRRGWEKCTGILEDDMDYPVVANSGNYTSTGKVYLSHSNPSAWTHDPFDGTEPPRKFIKGHWYQCVDYTGKPEVRKYAGNECFTQEKHRLVSLLHYQWVGKSMGKLEFPAHLVL